MISCLFQVKKQGFQDPDMTLHLLHPCPHTPAQLQWLEKACQPSLYKGPGATETCTASSQSNLALVSQVGTQRLPEAGRRKGAAAWHQAICMWPDWILKITREVCTRILRRSRAEAISQSQVHFLVVAPNNRRLGTRNPPPHNKSQHCKISNWLKTEQLIM